MAIATPAMCDGSLDFRQQPVGTTSTEQTFTYVNGSDGPVVIGAIAYDACPDGCAVTRHNDAFVVTGGTCTPGHVIAPGAGCNLRLTFAPRFVGSQDSGISLLAFYGPGATSLAQLSLYGTGVDPSFSRGPTIGVVEYYDAALDQYLITSAPDEIAALDAGTRPEWQRTGSTFRGLVPDDAGVYPGRWHVCRYFVVTDAGTTHWYFHGDFVGGFAAVYTCGPTQASGFGSVRAAAHEGDPFDDEPPTFDGWCPYATLALYQLWDRRIGHRYTIDPAIRLAMIGQGWVPDGYGAAGVFSCVPAG